MFSLDEFLVHYGVQGMHWGQRRAYNRANKSRLIREKGLTRRQARNTNRAQHRVDVKRMIATSNIRLTAGARLSHPVSSQRSATLELHKNRETQIKIEHGKKRVTAALIRVHGVSIKDLDFTI